MKDHLIRAMKSNLDFVPEASSIRWVLTVPAIWDENAKQFMREAAYKVSDVHRIHIGVPAIENVLSNRRTRIKIAKTVFSIAIRCQSGDKWQSKTLFITLFDLRSSKVLTLSLAGIGDNRILSCQNI